MNGAITIDPTKAFRKLCRDLNSEFKGMDSRADNLLEAVRKKWKENSSDEGMRRIIQFVLADYLKHGFFDFVDDRLYLYRKLDPQIALLDFLADNPDRFDKEHTSCPTNVPGLDTILKSGLLIPEKRGIHIVLKGAPGTGKTTLALQLAHNFALQGQNVLYITVEQSVDQLKFVLSRFDITSSKHGSYNLFTISQEDGIVIDEEIKKKQGALILNKWPHINLIIGSNAQRDGKEKIADRIYKTIENLKEILRKIGIFPNWLVIDSANAIPGILVREINRDIKEKLRRGEHGSGLSLILVSEAVFPKTQGHKVEEFVGDMILELGHRHFEIGEGPNPSNDYDQRYIDITKSRYQSVHRGQHPLSIKDNGIVVHNSSAIAFKITSKTSHPHLDEDLMFGIEGLDEIINGSILKGTTTLLTGNSMPVKLATSLQFLAEGLEDDDNCSIYFFSDNRRELAGLLESHSYKDSNVSIYDKFKKKISMGKLDIRCVTPGYLFPEDVLGNLERELRDDPLYQLLERGRINQILMKVLGVTADDDWTKEKFKKDFNNLKRKHLRYARIKVRSIKKGKTPSVISSRIVIADVDKIAAQFPIIYKNEFFFQTLFQILRKYGISCIIIGSVLEIEQRRRHIDLRPLVDNVIRIDEVPGSRVKAAEVTVKSSLKMIHKPQSRRLMVDTKSGLVRLHMKKRS